MGILKTPKWLPVPVSEEAEKILSDIAKGKYPPSALAELQNLVAHPAMRQVWRSLNQRNRADGLYRYSREAAPASAIWTNAVMSPSSAKLTLHFDERLHDISLRAFFRSAFLSALHAPPVVTLPELISGRARREEVVQKLRKIAALVEKDDAILLNGIADRHAKNAVLQPEKYGNLIVKRSGRNRELRGMVIYLSEEMCDWFGAPLDGAVARVANVILRMSTINGAAVRSIVRGLRKESGIKNSVPSR